MKKKLNINKKIIPVSSPLITKKDISYVVKSLKEGWVSSSGPYIEKFEEKFSKLVEKKYGILVSNCTAALEIVVKSLRIKKNNEVIIPNFTIISNGLSVIKNNLKMVPVDCDLKTWNMNIDEAIQKINKQTKAIIATHIYNYPLEIDRLKKICQKKKIFLIEDAAEVIGLKYKKKYCGSYGDLSVFSFYSTKQITMGEGGIICTNNKAIADRCRALKNLCFGRKDRFNHDEIGWNYRATSMQAALGLSQLKRLDKIVSRKKQIGKIYYNLLKDNPYIYIPKPKLKNLDNIYWIVGIVLDKSKTKTTAKKLSDYLKNNKILTRPFFWPMNDQNIFKKMNLNNNKNKFPNSEYLSKNGLYLPSGLGIKNSEISFICKKLNSYKFN